MILIKLLVICIGVIFAFRVLKWEEGGGLYYAKYPVAKAMDKMSSTGELDGVDIEMAIADIDYSKPRSTHAAQFRSNVLKQKNKV
ncbi:hypothetical protein [Pseudoalteromonas luteoviolacea]|uniref:hypothetical protein n=1 Tax=Pseudoalteromonas luteoviolacea TaxID=43657 RepID=UPI001B37C99C|nr:hypothetical protein [Pseudoalteromonas luteoviolacea]MBQ4839820.1 hypothetical protein [Pseudoalteromonas luteoviolacea]